ncbi:piggyBac transposable element-derived protein 4-like [Stegodyphus dumicola]|uniref:piggyBac transposable element-derived protein 4-like n=1 Tax=Stegodyphus dumicola TaxID=202533 RepID=UPI0015AFEEDB|nr:piggyBac transposable element-derived protein 4-like [Stegodyphus dumicola]
MACARYIDSDSSESDSEDDFGSEYRLDVSESDCSDFGTSETESDSDSESLSDARQWCELNRDTPNPAPPEFIFQGHPGLNFFPDSDDILQFFEYFFDDGTLQIICNETNRYASQYLKKNELKKESRAQKWYPTTKNEIMILLVVFTLQGIAKKPEEDLYWCKKEIFHTPIFGKLLSKRRYKLLVQFLHFADNEVYDPESHPNPKLCKIWPLFERLNGKFMNAYSLSKNVSIDESLMLYKGRLGWVQYMPLKRARFGIKFYMLCESESGYIWSCIIYTGKGTILNEQFKNLPVSSQVVMTLLYPLLKKGHCVTTDNFYTSPELAELLIAYKTDIYGTVRLNRKGMPIDLKKRKLKKGEIAAFQKGKIMVLKWKDKKDVALLSTVHNMEMVAVTRRKENKMKPKVVVDYNGTMGGVDRVDQRLSSYNVTKRRGKKYYKKIFLHLLDITLWNSYVLYTKSGGKRSHLQYRTKIIENIIEKYHSVEFSAKKGRPSADHPPSRLSERHFVDYIPPTEKKSNPRRQCIICCSKRDSRGKKVRRETRFYCPDCDVGLCAVPCFRMYHTRSNFD